MWKVVQEGCTFLVSWQREKEESNTNPGVQDIKEAAPSKTQREKSLWVCALVASLPLFKLSGKDPLSPFWT